VAGQILLFLPYDPGIARLVIVHDGQELFSRSVSPNAPTVALDPIVGTVSDPLTVSWDGADADGDELSYALLFSSDGGLTWEPQALRLGGDTVRFGTSFWPQTDQGYLRIQAGDGMNTAEDVTGPFTVPSKGPAILSISPADGDLVPVGEPVYFLLTTYDAEDGPIEGDGITWTGSRAGHLGTGDRILVPELGAGWHSITVDVTDSDSYTATQTIDIYAGQRRFLPLLPAGDPTARQDDAAGNGLLGWLLDRLNGLIR
jgi:hypothetical protein